MIKHDPQYPIDPSFCHCHGENREDQSDETVEYCSGDSESCNCKCEECVALVAEFWAYERHISAMEDYHDSLKDSDGYFFDEEY